MSNSYFLKSQITTYLVNYYMQGTVSKNRV